MSSVFSNGFRQRLFWRHSCFEAAVKCGRNHSILTGENAQVRSNSEGGHHVRSTCILALLDGCLPSAVSWFVIPVVVDASNGCSGRSVAHVGKEVLKARPAFTDFDSSSAVMFKAFCGRVLASSPHSLPACVLWTLRHPVGAKIRLTKTPARLAHPSQEACSKNHLNRPAETSAHVGVVFATGRAVMRRAISNHNPVAKGLIDERYFVGHSNGSSIVLSSGGTRLHAGSAANNLADYASVQQLQNHLA